MELGLILDMAVSDDPERVALVDADGHTLTRGELQHAALAVAERLQRDGATALGYLAPNHLAFAVGLFGAATAGVPFVPLNYRLPDDQLSAMIAAHEGMVLVEADDRDRFLADALAAPRADVAPVADDDAIAVLLYTSGTTSAPKAAVLRHRHLTSYVLTAVDFGSAGDDAAVLVSVPPYHVAGVTNLVSNLYAGRKIVYLDPFDASRWLALVESEGITHAMVVPTMLARIVDALGERAGPALPSLAYGGAKTPLPVLERALWLFPDTAFSNAYGLTETSSTITVLGPDDHRIALTSDDAAVRARLGSVGTALPGIEIEIRDNGGVVLAPDETGDVFVRGEQVSGEYAGLGSVVDADGWFATRDRGRLDPNGYLFIEGRTDDTIIRGGENIAPVEIEEVLLRHDDVGECAVVGIADEEWGQRIAAVVVAREGRTVDVEALRAYARGELRSSKTPDVVVVRDELPYTDTGKLLRRIVRADLEDQPADSGH